MSITRLGIRYYNNIGDLFMDTNTIILFAILIVLVESTVTDIILFKKLFNTKKIVTENNREIYEHDKIIVDLQEQVEEIKHQ